MPIFRQYLLILAVVSSALGATLYVSPTGSDSSNCEAAITPCKTIKYAYALANNGDTISLSAGTFDHVNNTGFNITGRTISFVGAGPDQTTVSGGNVVRFIAVGATSNVTIKGFTITNGTATKPLAFNSQTGGGAITIENSIATIENMRFVRNLAPGSINNAPGGALLIFDSVVNIQNSEFLNNQGGIASAVFFGGTSRTTVQGCTFRGNFNLGGWGGALVPEGNSETTIENCWFEDNYSDYGGAIDDGSSAIWSCTNCTFYRNRGLYGGAYYGYGRATATFRRCSFIENTTPNAGGASQTTSESKTLFEDCLFAGNSAADTGALGTNNYGTTIRRCTFRENRTPTVASALNIRVNTTVEGCIFERNSAGERGAIAVTGDRTNVIRDCVFIDNYSSISAPALLFESAIPYNLAFNNLTFINNTARLTGGAMAASGAGRIVINGITASGGLGGSGGLLSVSGQNLIMELTHANIQNVKATQGAVFYITQGATLRVENSNIHNNEAISGGGVALIEGESKLYVSNSNVTSNTARYGGFTSYSLFARDGCHVSVSQSSLDNNTAVAGGGLIWSEADVPPCTYNFTLTSTSQISGGTYGDIIASPPHLVRLERPPPLTVSPSEPFSALLMLLDFFNQTVKSNKGFVGEVTIMNSTNPAAVGGISREDITPNGTISFNLLRITARPGTVLQIDFHTLPRVSRSEIVTLTVTQCQPGFEEYVTGTGAYYCLRTVDTTSAIQIALGVVGGILLIGSLVLLVVLFLNRTSPIIRAASPLFCMIIVVGGFFTYISAFMFLWNSDATCALRPWFYAIGFMTMYGSLFVKEFRMFRIFNADLTKRVRITNKQLVGVVSVGVLVEMAILIGWFASSPYVKISRIDDLDSTPVPAITYECSTRNSTGFWILVAFNLLLLVVCSVIAFLTRNLPDTLNESRGLAFAIYNCTITMVVCLAIGAVLYSPAAVSLVGAIGVVFSSTVTLVALFLPKLWLALRKDAVIASIRKEIVQLKNDINWKERQIKDIERGFQGGDSSSSSAQISSYTLSNVDATNSTPISFAAGRTAAKSSNGDAESEDSDGDSKSESDWKMAEKPKTRATNQPN